jgi:hypothetical protein
MNVKDREQGRTGDEYEKRQNYGGELSDILFRERM